jgi:nitrous oxidase accessory protein NosD
MKSLIFALSAIASFAADSLGQTIINSLPYTISAPGTYVLGSNLVYSSAANAAIQIFSSNVTLDLGGHYLYYPGTPSSKVGVYVHDAGNVIIQNGIIAGFTYGAYFERTGGPQGTALNSGNIVQNLRLTDDTYGVILYNVAGSIVRNNQITSSPSSIQAGISITGPGNLVSGNVISGFSAGVFSAGENYFLENTVSNGDFGFLLQPDDKYRFNTTFNCTTPFRSGVALTDENN